MHQSFTRTKKSWRLLPKISLVRSDSRRVLPYTTRKIGLGLKTVYTRVRRAAVDWLYRHQTVAIRKVTRTLQRATECALHLGMGLGKTKVAFAVGDQYSGPKLYITLAALVPQVNRQLWGVFGSKKPLTWTVAGSVPRQGRTYCFTVVDEYHKRNKAFADLLRSTVRGPILLLTGSPPTVSAWSKATVVAVEPVRGTLRSPAYEEVALSLTPSQRERYAAMVQSASGFVQLQRDRRELSGWKVFAAVQLLRGVKRAVIFSEFNSTLTELCLKVEQPHVCFGSSPLKRAEAVKRFVQQGGVLLCSTAVAAHGVDLGCANLLVLVESIYKQRDLRQTVARLVRLGQLPGQRVVQLYHAATFEERLLRSNTTPVPP